MNSGLYARAGASATATAAACANRLDAPITNVSNVYFSLRRVLEVCGWAGAVNGCPGSGGSGGRGCCWCWGPGQISWPVASASPSSSTSSLSESAAPLSPLPSGFSGLLMSSALSGASTSVCSTSDPTPGRGVPGRGWPGAIGTLIGGGGGGDCTTTGGGGANGLASTASTFTARETTRPSRRDSASVIGSRSARSIASFAKSLGAASNAVPSSRPLGRVTRIHARCCGESVPADNSRTTCSHTTLRFTCCSDTYELPSPRWRWPCTITATPRCVGTLVRPAEGERQKRPGCEQHPQGCPQLCTKVRRTAAEPAGGTAVISAAQWAPTPLANQEHAR